jgi:hypothetical protein
MPLFFELRPYLDRAFDRAPEGAVYCVCRSRDASNTNLRTGLLRILRRAGVKPWERLFHNLRASRQTELCNQFPSHVVAEWLGNTPDVADKHYLLVTEQHFQQASSGGGPQTAAQGGATGGARQNEKGGADGGAACERNESNSDANPFADNDILQGDADLCDAMQNAKVHSTGLEPVTFGSVDRCSIQLS